MTFKQQLGCQVQVPFNQQQLFVETQSRFISTVRPENQTAFEAFCQARAQQIGTVTATPIMQVQTTESMVELSVTEAKLSWETAIPCQMK